MLVVRKHNHGFAVASRKIDYLEAIRDFANDFYSKKEFAFDRNTGLYVPVQGSTFYFVNNYGNVYGFHAEAYDKFMKHMKSRFYTGFEVSIDDINPTFTPIKADIQLLDKIKPRTPAQEALVPFIISDTNGHLRIVPLPTGQGKTLSTLMALREMMCRAAFVMRSGHILTWLETLENYTNLEAGKDYVVIKGSAGIQKLIDLALNHSHEEQPNFYLIASQAIAVYIKEYYELNLSDDYAVAPDKLYELLSIAVEVTDECHELIDQVLNRFIWMPVYKRITLSATLDSRELFAAQCRKELYPHRFRFTDYEENKHVCAVEVFYHLSNVNPKKFERAKGYSQVLLETYVLKNKNVFNNLMGVIKELFVEEYLNKRRREEGTRALVMFATKLLTTKACEWLKKEFPELDIARMHGEDKKDVVDKHEIVFTTPGSCGTGRDVKDCVFNFCYISMDSEPLIVQAMGRSRPIRTHMDIDPIFYFTTCLDLPKHMKYSMGHRKLLPSKTKSTSSISKGDFHANIAG